MSATSFVTWFDPTLECTSVWDGKQYLTAKDGAFPLPSSLNEGTGYAPAKPLGPGGGRGTRGSGVVSQSAMRA